MDQDESVDNNVTTFRTVALDPSVRYWALDDSQFGSDTSDDCSPADRAAPSASWLCLYSGAIPRTGGVNAGAAFIDVQHGSVVEVMEKFLS
jgi:hypothetical protein